MSALPDCAGCKPWRIEYTEAGEPRSHSVKGYAKAYRWAMGNVKDGVFSIVPDEGQKTCC